VRKISNGSEATKKETVRELDHAFELALILINILSGILAQYTTMEQKEIVLPPIVANVRRVSIVFVFPTILIILAWVTSYFSDDETWRMRLKTYAWSSLIFLTLLASTEFYVISLPTNSPEWTLFPIAIPILPGMVFPIIPWLLMRKVLRRYKMEVGDIRFFAEGKLGRLNRWLPFFLAWVIFWAAFKVTLLG